MEHKTKNILNAFFAISLFIFIDQLSKYIIRLKGGFYICNPNIAFGIAIFPVVFWIFWMAIVVIISRAILKLLAENKKSLKLWGLILILAGALANMIDRIALGCVVDFIDIKTCLPAGMVWPVFNLADSFIVLGAVLWLVKFKKI